MWASLSDPMASGEGGPQRHLGCGTGPLGPAQESYSCSDSHSPTGGLSARFSWPLLGKPHSHPSRPGVWNRVEGALCKLALLQHFCSHTQLSQLSLMKQENQHKVQCRQHTLKQKVSLPPSAARQSQRFSVNMGRVGQ